MRSSGRPRCARRAAGSSAGSAMSGADSGRQRWRLAVGEDDEEPNASLSARPRRGGTCGSGKRQRRSSSPCLAVRLVRRRLVDPDRLVRSSCRMRASSVVGMSVRQDAVGHRRRARPGCLRGAGSELLDVMLGSLEARGGARAGLGAHRQRGVEDDEDRLDVVPLGDELAVHDDRLGSGDGDEGRQDADVRAATAASSRRRGARREKRRLERASSTLHEGERRRAGTRPRGRRAPPRGVRKVTPVRSLRRRSLSPCEPPKPNPPRASGAELRLSRAASRRRTSSRLTLAAQFAGSFAIGAAGSSR